MTKKNIRTTKNFCFIVAGVSMFFILLGNAKNNPLTLLAFASIIVGLVLNYFEDKK